MTSSLIETIHEILLQSIRPKIQHFHKVSSKFDSYSHSNSDISLKSWTHTHTHTYTHTHTEKGGTVSQTVMIEPMLYVNCKS